MQTRFALMRAARANCNETERTRQNECDEKPLSSEQTATRSQVNTEEGQREKYSSDPDPRAECARKLTAQRGSVDFHFFAVGISRPGQSAIDLSKAAAKAAIHATIVEDPTTCGGLCDWNSSGWKQPGNPNGRLALRRL